MAFTDMFANSKFELVAPDGSVRATGKGQFDGNKIMIFEPEMQIFPGDELRRTLPSGVDEAFEVIDPVFYGSIPSMAHYEVKVRRKGVFPHHSGGHYNITVSGENARVNLHSSDHSTNNVVNSGVFSSMIEAVRGGVPDHEQQRAIVTAIQEMERQKGQSGFLKAYQTVISVAADHVGLLGPFLPALGAYLA